MVMNNSDEILKKTAENEPVLQAIAELAKTVAEISGKFDNFSGRFDKLEKFVTLQFDAVQEGIAYNSAKFDRLEAKFYEARSDISNMRADIKELTQVVRKKELV
jgi:peptidoglycan hydrolase CwlO-like protein